MRRLLALVAFLLPAAAQAEPQQMVAAAHPMAVEAGLEILKRGERKPARHARRATMNRRRKGKSVMPSVRVG